MAKPFVPQKLPLAEIKWKPLIPLIGRANRALAHYEGVLYGVPHPDILLSPMTTHEAVFSPELLDNGEKYYHSEDPDPLVQFAVGARPVRDCPSLGSPFFSARSPIRPRPMPPGHAPS